MDPAPSSPGHPRPISEYFSVADSGRHALISPEGRCEFLCWPNVDSRLALCSLLDPAGGSVGVRPPGGGASTADWDEGSRVVRVAWRGELSVRCGLVQDETGPWLVWLVEGAAGASLEVVLDAPAKGGAAGWSRVRDGALLPRGGPADGPGGPLRLWLSGEWVDGAGGLRAQADAQGRLALWLGGSGDWPSELPPRDRGPGVAQALLEQQRDLDRRWLGGLSIPRQLPSWASAALRRSLLTLRGLQHPFGLLPASPLTSIPQWPGSSRSWDYRYAWLRDSADAGGALLRAGAVDEARALALGLASQLAGGPDSWAPVRRLDGSPLPRERELEYLEGYSGALVRVGNGAEGQLQLDTLGEVAALAEELVARGACPPELLQLVPALADRAAATWREPDHGIWEIRGTRRHYLHSKILAWVALSAAARLAREGSVQADPRPWELEAAAIVTTAQGGEFGRGTALDMAPGLPAADAALLAGCLKDFPPLGGPAAEATLERVERKLGRGPLLARYQGELDGIAWPCLPFLFPALWAASLEVRLGRREQAEERLAAISALAGVPGQLSEVADPERGVLLGNYPQVQSHAALIVAILDLWGGS